MDEFKRVMSERTDEQLIEIVTRKRHEYQPGALDAADAEFKRRALPLELMVRVDNEVTERDAVVAARSSAPLSVGWKILSFFFPGLVVFFAVLFLKANGRDRQAGELGRWALFGIGFYLLLAAILARR